METCSEGEMEEEDKVGKTDVSPNVLQQPRKAKTKVTIFSTLTEGEAEDLDKGFGMALAKHVPKEKVLTGIPEEDIPATL
ncbi:Transcription factor AP-2-alpha [Labeo rohita]|uniref:Transcription factor AP-2-alpha n=1 Tax=Labeo rohita TaxID=84645 RepID=A0ABQ8L5X7_LABRO|nr:Transcription factor AP-2-alpha [Labeo rohita]